jgi:hypothetical protein
VGRLGKLFFCQDIRQEPLPIERGDRIGCPDALLFVLNRCELFDRSISLSYSLLKRDRKIRKIDDTEIVRDFVTLVHLSVNLNPPDPASGNKGFPLDGPVEWFRDCDIEVYSDSPRIRKSPLPRGARVTLLPP